MWCGPELGNILSYKKVDLEDGCRIKLGTEKGDGKRNSKTMGESGTSQVTDLDSMTMCHLSTL